MIYLNTIYLIRHSKTLKVSNLFNNESIKLNENAPAILYSYLRPMITTITVDANLPPLVIPLMNFREQNQTK